MKPTYPMSKKAKIQFWIVTLYDPTAEMEYEQYEGMELRYVRTMEEAKDLVIKHTLEYMPKQDDFALDKEWEAYRQWTPFNPQTGEPNEPLPQPSDYKTMPLYDFTERISNSGEATGGFETKLNDLALKIGYDDIGMTYNEETWGQNDPIATMHLHTIE